MVQPAAAGGAPRTRREARALLRPAALPLPPAPAPPAPPAVPLRRPRARSARPRVAFRPDVEGLRAVAVVLVVLFHAGLGPAGGYVGVDVFFVISGFLITSLLVDEVRATGGIALGDFYARRVRRLLPAACLVLVVTLFASAVVLPPVDGPTVADDVRAAALFFANWHFAALETDYFAGGGHSLVVHFWSLSVEEQFYLAWPVLVLLVAGRRRARRAARPAPRDTDRRLWATLAPVALVSLALSAVTTASAGPWAYFGTHTRAWELAAGAAVALARPHLHRIGDRQFSVLGWGGLVAVVGSALVFDETTAVPGVALLVPVTGAAAIVAAGARSQRGVAALLGHRPLAMIGRLSYSWYLWHWPCLELVRRVTVPPAVDDLPPPDAPVALRLLAVAVSLGLAVLTFRYVEQPARAARFVLPVRRALPAGAVLVGGTVLAALVVLPGTAPAPAPAEGAVAVAPAATPSASPSRAGRGRPTPPTADAARPAAAPVLRMSPAAARTDQAPTRDCFAGFGPTTAPTGCRFGSPDGARVVVLVGDSHAAHWFPALQAAAERQGWQLWFWAKSGCAYADVREWLPSYRREYTECSAWRRSAFGRIAALPRVDLVVVGRGISYLGQVMDGDGTLLDRAAAAPVWADGARRSFEQLGAPGRRVLLLRDVPRPGFDVPACLSARGTAACTFARAGHVNPDAQLWAAEQPVVRSLGLPVADLSPVICPADPCHVVSSGGAAIYRDTHHLTATFAREAAPAVLATLRRYVP